MLKAVITYLNLKLGLLNYFDLTRCLSELKVNNEGLTSPKEYISNGNWDNIDFDSKDGVSYWRLRDEITTSPIESIYKAGKRVEVTIPLKLVFSVPRRKLTEDDAYAFDRIRQTITKQFNIDDGDLKNTLGCEKVEISSPTANGDAKEVWDGETENTGTHEPNYDVVFGSVDIDVKLIYKGTCLPTECDDVDSDILHSFDFCNAAVRDRLTAAQITCLEDALCAACVSVTEQINGVTIGTVASGGTNNQLIQDSAGASVGTEANPSVIGDATVTINSTSLGATGSIVAEGSVDLVVNLDGSPSGSWDGNSWEVTSAACDDATVENSDASYSTTVASGGTLVVPDTAISANGDLVINQPSTIAKDITVRYDTQGTVATTISGGEIVVPDVAPSAASLTIGVYSDAGHTTPITEIDFNETVYITATVIGFTATDYTFTISGGGQLDEVINQVGSSVSFVSHRYGDVLISVVASDGIDSAGSQFELTANWDWDNNIYADGVNDYLGGSTVIFNTTPDDSLNWSLSMWFKLELPLTGKWLFYVQNSRYGNGFFRALFNGDNINIRLMADPNVDVITPFTHDENWHNLVVTRANNEITYWIDGVVYVNYTGWGSNGLDSFKTTGGIFTIGFGTLAKGFYRDITFWRRGLVQADVDQIWNSGNGGVPPLDESIGYWRPTNALGTTTGTVNDSTNQNNVINFNGFSAPYGVVTNQV
jgi:hypothetical protein